MVDSDKSAFKQLIADVMAYYGKDTSGFTYSVFWDALVSFDFESVQRAFSSHAQDTERGRFAPKVADILLVLGAGQGGDVKAQRAWAKVLNAVRRIGPVRNIVFDDPAIHATLRDMGGFSRLCSSKTEEMPFRAKDFESIYKSYLTGPEYPYPPMIKGDYEDCETVMVGDRIKAKGVLEGGSRADSISTDVDDIVAKALAGSAA